MELSDLTEFSQILGSYAARMARQVEQTCKSGAVGVCFCMVDVVYMVQCWPVPPPSPHGGW